MKDECKEDIKFFLLTVLCILVLTAFIVFFVMYFRIHANSQVEVFVENKMIFKGPRACVNISSGGNATLVSTYNYNGILCLFIDKTYVLKDEDIVINTIEQSR